MNSTSYCYGRLRGWSTIICSAILALILACSAPPETVPAVASTSSAALSQIAAQAPPASPPLSPSHIFFIVMENREYQDVIGNDTAPYLNSLAAQYALADRMYAIRHPSLPNYLSLISGHTYGIDSDCTDCLQDDQNLVDTLEARGLTWKSYQEDIPRPCFLGDSFNGYALKHDPFLYFQDVRENPSRCNQVVPFEELAQDEATSSVPDFAWITPNLDDDMHDTTIADGDQWLAKVLPGILASDAWKQDGLIIVTWDEGRTDKGCCGAEGGQVATLFISPSSVRGSRYSQPITHYGLLRTIEDLWGLPYLGHSGDPDTASAASFLRGQRSG